MDKPGRTAAADVPEQVLGCGDDYDPVDPGAGTNPPTLSLGPTTLTVPVGETMREPA